MPISRSRRIARNIGRSISEGNITSTGAISGGGASGGKGTITAGALDLSTGDVFEFTPTADTTMSFTNPPTGHSFSFVHIGAGITGTSISQDATSVSDITQGTEFPRGNWMPKDGTRLYISASSNTASERGVYQYSLSTAHDISSQSYVGFYSLNGFENQPFCVAFKPDGTKMYIAGQQNDIVYQHSLSTAWTVSTASYDSKSYNPSHLNPGAIAFKSDGTVLYTAAASTIKSHNLSTAWDVSTASSTNGSTLNVSSQSPNSLSGLDFSSDGKHMFTLDSSSDKIHSYRLSTAWDISTATYRTSSSAISGGTPMGVSVTEPSGSDRKLFVSNFNGAVYQFTFSTYAPYVLTWPSSVVWDNGSVPSMPDSGETDLIEFTTSDGGTTYYGRQNGNAFS